MLVKNFSSRLARRSDGTFIDDIRQYIYEMHDEKSAQLCRAFISLNFSLSVSQWTSKGKNLILTVYNQNDMLAREILEAIKNYEA